GTHGNAMDCELADFLQKPWRMIFAADARSAGYEDYIRTRVRKRVANLFRIVPGPVVRLDHAAVALDHTAKHCGVAIVDLVERFGFTGIHELVPGGDDPHTRAFDNVHVRNAQ